MLFCSLLFFCKSTWRHTVIIGKFRGGKGIRQIFCLRFESVALFAGSTEKNKNRTNQNIKSGKLVLLLIDQYHDNWNEIVR